jgi:nitrogen regulatory protein PII
MKLVTAVVKLDKLDQVVHAVAAAGARGLTATEVSGRGCATGANRRARPGRGVRWSA